MKKKSGFTLIELILAIALASLVILGGANLLIFGINNADLVYDEFDMQSNVRIMSTIVNDTIRDSAATFILHRDNADSLTNEWNYIMLNTAKTKLIEYKWNPSTSTHDEREIFSGMPGVTLNLEFDKDNPANIDRLLKFHLEVIDDGKSTTIESELESNNSLQVVDRSYAEIANTLAYRFDARIDEVSNAQATVAMVLDKSGSMGDKLNGYSASDWSSDSDKWSRMKKLKIEANRLLDGLAAYPNIWASINPFDSTANSSEIMLEAQVNNVTNTGLVNKINALSANGGTNTGDGIRRAYYHIKDFNELPANASKTNKNFMIILVDGVTTFASVNKVTDDTISFPTDQGATYTFNGLEYDFDDDITRRLYVDEGPIYDDGTNEYAKVGSAEYWGNEGWFTDQGSSYTKTYNGGTVVEFKFDEKIWNNYYGRYVYYYNYYRYNYIRYEYSYSGVQTADYFTGDNDIDSHRIDSSNYNTTYSPARYAGEGNALDPWGTEYVNIIGQLVKDYKKGTNEAIKVYVIGFSSRTADYGSLSAIATATDAATTPDGDAYYEAGSSEALQTIFDSIEKDISDALWHIGGPN